MTLFPAEIIKKKRSGQTLTREEIEFFIGSYVADQLPDYQMAALLMAIFFKGMTPDETFVLTDVMMKSGRVLDFSYLSSPSVDKHSTGGVGDKTSMILAPIVAAAGVPVPMIAGRGLGHTGGTLDKLEAIPGMSVQLDIPQFQKQVETLGVAMIGQTEDICPADKRIYALRDVSGTVESLPLICASIMSKKLAEGMQGLVLDVKFGTGAFMKSKEDCERLATGLMSIAKLMGKKVRALLTNMNQPLGLMAGNALEILECVQIFKQENHSLVPLNKTLDADELSRELSAHMLVLGEKAKDTLAAREQVDQLIQSGKAFEVFEKMVHAQGGRLSDLPLPQQSYQITASENGYISGFECEQIGLAGIALKAGRLTKADAIDPVAGIATHKKVGEPVEKGEPLFTLYSSSTQHFAEAAKMLQKAVNLSQNTPSTEPLIWKVLQ